MLLVQDRSLDLLASCPACYHCTTNASCYKTTLLSSAFTDLFYHLFEFLCFILLKLLVVFYGGDIEGVLSLGLRRLEWAREDGYLGIFNVLQVSTACLTLMITQ